jgi:hypothetical protein
VSGSVEHCPVVESHTPTWHWSEDGQLAGLVPVHTPFAQMSVCVHALSSLQGTVLLVFTHPVAGLQLSSVHTLPSSQLGAGPPTQDPPEQVSFVVHALLSSHGAVLLEYTHPDSWSQLSSVHTFLSSQFSGGPLTHDPPEQVSFAVHALPSVQGAVLLLWAHPVVGLQLSSVHTLLSSQLGAGPPAHDPPEQVSFVVHALPSSHATVLLVCTHPDAGLQLSLVQMLLSSRFAAGPATHASPRHLSFVVHALPSVHGVVSGNPVHDATGVLPAHPMHW